MIEDLKKRAGALKREAYALVIACKDPRVPWYARLWLALVAAYAFSPIDLIPDFIPVLGYLDDLLLVPLGVALAIRMIPSNVMAEARIQSEALAAQGRPTNRAGAVIVITVWLIILAILAWLVILLWPQK